MGVKNVGFCAVAIGLLVLAACGPNLQPYQVKLDSPYQHAVNGMKLLKLDKIDGAHREFSRAEELDPDYAPAHIGLGLVYGLRRDFPKAMGALQEAGQHVRGDHQQVALGIAFMRLYMFGREKLSAAWLLRVEDEFNQARRLAPHRPEIFFQLGLAYKLASIDGRPPEELDKIVRLNKGYLEEEDLVKNLPSLPDALAPGGKIVSTHK
jgi:tetratricopeptide (TPR) repeat protein